MQQRFGFAGNTQVMAGTTDSTAAFLACGATEVGEAMTSLGSTLVIKIISDKPVFAPQYGIYSHRINDHWLAGGASNSGGAVLKAFFSVDEIVALSERIDPHSDTGLDYYPLPQKGERFPYNDPQLSPRLEPRPSNDAEFLQGLLEGITHIEHRGYQLLSELGAPYPTSIRTVGKGARNANWSSMRARILETTLINARNQDAAFGSALLAKRGYNNTQPQLTI